MLLDFGLKYVCFVAYDSRNRFLPTLLLTILAIRFYGLLPKKTPFNDIHLVGFAVRKPA